MQNTQTHLANHDTARLAMKSLADDDNTIADDIGVVPETIVNAV